jgi:hypothetical protein
MTNDGSGFIFLASFMKRSGPRSAKLESELVRLNELVRQRRQQLARLEDCPNHKCECRHVWREVVENKLAIQVSKVGKHVRKVGGTAKTKANSRPRHTAR